MKANKILFMIDINSNKLNVCYDARNGLAPQDFYNSVLKSAQTFISDNITLYKTNYCCSYLIERENGESVYFPMIEFATLGEVVDFARNTIMVYKELGVL